MKKIKQFFKKHGTRFLALSTMVLLLIPMLCSMAMPTDSYVIKAGTYRFKLQPIDYNYNYTQSFYEYNMSIHLMFDGVYYNLDVLNFNIYKNDELISYDGYIESYDLPDPLFIQDENDDYFTDGWFNDYDRYITVLNDYPCDKEYYDVFMNAVERPTETITNVWTGIIDWLTSSLNSVQGLFISNDSSIASILDFNDSLDIDGNVYYRFTNDDVNVYYNGIDISVYFGKELGVYDNIYIFGVDDSVPLIAINSDNASAYLRNLPELTVAGTPQLTFLGTLAVIGLSIAFAMLLIMVIKRFLSLRS